MSSDCPHVNIVGDYTQDDIVKKQQQSKCDRCSETGPNLWVCLHRDCLFVGCGDGQADHSAKHFKEKSAHALTLNLLSLRVWCYLCEREVFIENNDPPAPGSAKKPIHHISSSHVSVAEPDMDDDDEDQLDLKPKGLTGLQNLGNTCYMNAALQSLSNCPQLTQFFLDCGSFVPNNKKPGLSKSYMTLMREIWHRRRPSYVVPSGIAHGIKMVFPVFRGFNQQDAQEFLRCFMDQLHEELKEAVVEIECDSDSQCRVPGNQNRRIEQNGSDFDSTCGSSIRIEPSQETSTEDSSQSEAEFETCDSGLSSEKSSYSEEFAEQEPMIEESEEIPLVPPKEEESVSPISINKMTESSDEGMKSLDGATYSSTPSIEAPVELVHQDKLISTPQPNNEQSRLNTSFRFTNSMNIPLTGRASSPTLKSRCMYKDQGASTKPKPPLYRSIISDTFDGKILSSVQCLTCDTLSTTRETFQDLSLPIPTRDHLHLLHAASHGGPVGQQKVVASGSSVVNSGTSVANCAEGHHRQGWFYWMFGWMLSWIWGPTISLQDCLSAFFSADELKGDNMYSCDKCKKLRNGIKYSKVLQLPEVLCIHLKRFRHEVMFSSKISSYVTFPLDGLDMSQFLHKDCPRSVTTYDLIAVICHHGTAGSGHYTSYAFNHLNEQWYEFDDQYVTAVDSQAVQNCEAYVLFYRKSSDEIVKKRLLAVELMERSKTEPGLMQFFISKQWVNRFNTFAEPGPITNTDFLCCHGGVPPSKAAFVDDLCTSISQAVWEYLYDTFGGGPPSNHLFVCPTCQKEEEIMNRRRKMEHDTFVMLNNDYQNQDSPKTVYALSMQWFKQWEMFVKGKLNESPGEIDNSTICFFKNGQPTLRTGSDYGSISDLMWKFLYEIYGGGPEVILQQNLPETHSNNGQTQQDPRLSSNRASNRSSGMVDGTLPVVSSLEGTSPSVSSKTSL